MTYRQRLALKRRAKPLANVFTLCALVCGVFVDSLAQNCGTVVSGAELEAHAGGVDYNSDEKVWQVVYRNISDSKAYIKESGQDPPTTADSATLLGWLYPGPFAMNIRENWHVYGFEAAGLEYGTLDPAVTDGIYQACDSTPPCDPTHYSQDNAIAQRGNPSDAPLMVHTMYHLDGHDYHFCVSDLENDIATETCGAGSVKLLTPGVTLQSSTSGYEWSQYRIGDGLSGTWVIYRTYSGGVTNNLYYMEASPFQWRYCSEWDSPSLVTSSLSSGSRSHAVGADAYAAAIVYTETYQSTHRIGVKGLGSTPSSAQVQYTTQDSGAGYQLPDIEILESTSLGHPVACIVWQMYASSQVLVRWKFLGYNASTDTFYALLDQGNNPIEGYISDAYNPNVEKDDDGNFFLFYSENDSGTKYIKWCLLHTVSPSASPTATPTATPTPIPSGDRPDTAIPVTCGYTATGNLMSGMTASGVSSSCFPSGLRDKWYVIESPPTDKGINVYYWKLPQSCIGGTQWGVAIYLGTPCDLVEKNCRTSCYTSYISPDTFQNDDKIYVRIGTTYDETDQKVSISCFEKMGDSW